MPGKEQTCAGEDGFSMGPVGKQFGSQRNPARVHWMRFQELNSINRRQRQKHKNKRRGARRTLFSANHGCWVFVLVGDSGCEPKISLCRFFLLFFFSSPRFAMKGFSPPFYFQPTFSFRKQDRTGFCKMFCHASTSENVKNMNISRKGSAFIYFVF